MTLKVMGAEAEYGSVRVGKTAHAEGNACQGNGLSSHAEGTQTIADGVSGHAEGGYSTAVAQYSHAGGSYSRSDGYASWSRASAHPSLLDASRAQHASYPLGCSLPTGAAAGPMTFNSSQTLIYSPSGTQNVLIVPYRGSYLCTLTFSGRRWPLLNGTGFGACYQALFVRDSGLRQVGSTITLATFSDPGITGWAVTFGVDVSNFAVTITLSNANSGTYGIHAVGRLDVTELVGTS